MIVSGFRRALLALALLLNASPAQSEVVRNSDYRFTLTKPDGWHDASRETVRSSSRTVGNESQASLSQVADATVLAFSKYKEPTDKLNSSFIMAGMRVGPVARSVSPVRAVEGSLQKVLQTGAQVKIVSPATAATLGGLPAAYGRFHLDATEGGRLHKSEIDIWVVARDESLLIIQIQADRADKAAGMDKLRAAVRSIRFER